MTVQSFRQEEILQFFKDILAQFPEVMYQINMDHNDFDVILHIPAQPFNRFPISLSLQKNDAIELLVGNFWLELYPATKFPIQQSFKEYVLGLLSGEYRIKELYLGGWCYSAQLQKANLSDWDNIANCGVFPLEIPLCRVKILQNKH